MITSFQGRYSWLSNFHMVSVLYEGIMYPSAEHAYQAAKSTNESTRLWVSSLASPSEAKKAGRTILIRPDWDDVKLDVMLEILRAKFQDYELRQRLLSTEDMLLVEGNWWGDKFWGVCNGIGCNHLGMLLMRVRSELYEPSEVA